MKPAGYTSIVPVDDNDTSSVLMNGPESAQKALLVDTLGNSCLEEPAVRQEVLSLCLGIWYLGENRIMQFGVKTWQLIN